MFDFPDTPVTGQALTGPGGVQYRWDGQKWVSVATPVAYLPLAGGTLTGALTLAGNAVAPLQPVTLQQVSTILGGPYLPLMGGTITGDLTVQGVTNAASGLVVGIDAGGSGSITLNGVKQSPKAIYLRTGGKNRWIMQSDATNETGGNLGSNFALSRYSDAGGLLGSALTIGRVDGSTQFYGPVYLSGDPTASNGAATKQYVDAHVAPYTQYGLVFDGVTDETAKFQQYLNDCRNNNAVWYLPADLVADGLVAYTSGSCANGARVLAKNNGQPGPVFSITPVAADIISVPVGEYSIWGDLFRGSAQVSGLSGRRGQFITIIQTNLAIGRSSGGGVVQQFGFVVWSDNGDVYPPLPDTLTWPGAGTVVTAQVMRHQVEISGLVIELSDPAGGAVERNQTVAISRCNTTLRGCQVRNAGSGGVQQAFVANQAALVRYESCAVDNISGTGVTNYGFGGNASAALDYVDCTARKTRRAIDGQSVSQVRVRGGAFDGGIGAHWGHDFDIDGATIALNYTGGNQSVFPFAGGNIRARNCTISLTGASVGVMSLRADIYECYGTMELANNNIIIDNRNNAIGASAALRLFDLAGVSGATAYDTLRPVTLPSLIRAQGNRVSFLGPSTATLYLLVVQSDWTSFPQAVTCDGQVIIDGNSFELENGLTDGSGNPRLSLTATRSKTQIGGGYRIRVRDLPCFYGYLLANSTVVNSASRHKLLIIDVPGPVRATQSAGVVSEVAMVNCTGTIAVNIPTPGAGYTPVGDEQIWSRLEATLTHTFYTLAGVAQPALLVTNTGAGGCLQIQNGVGTMGLAAQGGTNVNMVITPRGTGQLGIGAPMQLKGFAFASVPSAATYNACMIRISDRSNRPATSDGTNWRFADGTVIA